jgi:hypothetical protein
MDQFTPRTDLALQLPRDMFHQVIHTCCGSLPAPVTNSPEDRVRRDNAAMARIACMLPANADEANIAAQCVAADAEALECLRQAREYAPDENRALRFSAQSASMMRQSRAARALLMRVQAQREKREADPGALGKANWIEHCALGLMAEALGHDAPAPMAEQEQAEAEPDLAEEADLYAIDHPRRVALFRSLGGLPAQCHFAPPREALLHAIVTGTSEVLRSLDTKSPGPADAAA